MLNFLFIFSLFLSALTLSTTRQKELSDVEHHADSEVHDAEYDHKAFLGKQDYQKYLELTPEESKSRLKKLIENKVDANKDGIVTKVELKDWISFISKKWMFDERDRVWNDYNPQNKTYIDFQFYSVMNFGENIGDMYTGDDAKRVSRDIDLDKQKWKLADINGDGLLDKEEFFGFLRPEEEPRMKPFLIHEMLVRADKNNDNYIDLNEYADELYSREPKIVRGKDPEPEWIKYELDHFSIHRDTNNDKKMDKIEIGEWIMPSNYDGVEAEVHHLVSRSDKNNNEELSIDEIMEQSELFVGSQATNYGQTLKNKEEL